MFLNIPTFDLVSLLNATREFLYLQLEFTPVKLIANDLLKTVHLFFVFAGVGGNIAQMAILRRHNGEDADAVLVEASEKMALAITRTVEFYGLVLALITGFALAFLLNSFSGAGYLHGKTFLVLVLIGLSHFDMRNLKRIVSLRQEGKVAEANQLKQTHLSLNNFSLILAAAIVFLVINKPF